MSTITAYNKSIGRNDIELESKEEQEFRKAIEEELKTWLRLPKTRDFILFLGKRELELLNAARNCSKVKLSNENTDKNLQKSIAYREIIDYLVTNKIPTE